MAYNYKVSLIGVNIMRCYETVVVLSVVGGEQELKDEIKKLETFLASKGAKNIVAERAGTKELGYKMKKQPVGHYVYFKFEADSEGSATTSSVATSITEEIQSNFRINEKILKFENHRIGLPARKFKGRTKAPGEIDMDNFPDADLGI